MEIYSYEEALKASLEYFRNDDLAAKVFLQKYALKDRSGNLYEKTPDDMHRRLAKELARIESNYPNPIHENEAFELMKGFKYLIPQGSPMTGIGNDFQIISLANCFVIHNGEDSYGSIMKIDEEQVHLMRRRGGVGHDLSHLRPKDSPTTCSALTSTGIVPFAERYSNTTREVGQDGRRGALMLSLSVEHPDIEDFIDAKLTQGKLTGANISVRITDDFMKSVIDGDNFYLKFNSSIYKTVKASKIWNKIIHNAWKSAEPGVLFWDNIVRESPADCYSEYGFKTISTNPCIIGDTLIAVADGRNAIPIKQLVEEGKDVLVYSTNPKTLKTEIKWGRNPRLTKKNVEVWKLTLDDGSSLIATPDHKIMLKDGNYCDLSELKSGQSLMPFNTYLSEGSWNEGYRCINSKSNGYARQYRMLYEFYNGKYDGKKFNVHHRDGNRLNDEISNLELELAKIHRSEHKLGENNPYYKNDNCRENLLSYASKPGEKNPRYISITNQEIIEEGKRCLELNNGVFTRNIWYKYVETLDKPIPSVSSKFRFNRFSTFKSLVLENHKVSSVEFYGYEDVYNLTVDDNHNYNIITSGDEKFINSSGITIKNCGEVPLAQNDSCRLLAINLYSYVENPFEEFSKFNFDLFKQHVRIAQRFMDDIVDLEIEKIDKIIAKVESDPEEYETKVRELNLWNKIKETALKGRRTGLGITAEGDMLAAMNLRYGSKEAIDFSERVHKVLAVEAYNSSIQLARERGNFPIWNKDLEKENPFICRVIREIGEEEPYLASDYFTYGRRNIACLTIAPTGTTSLMSQTSSGIEPAFLIYYQRRRKINPNDTHTRVDFVDEVGDKWEEYNVIHPKFITWYYQSKNNKDFVGNYFLGFNECKDYLEKLDEGVLEILFKQSPYYKSTSKDIDWVAKVEMQGRIQKWVDHSISVTVNLPEETTVETVGKIYETAWKSGCKGMTVYREGSRSGVLNSKKKESTTFPKERPEVVECDINHLTIKGEKWIVCLGIVNKKPYEVFAFKYELDKKFNKGRLIKIKSKQYNLEIIGDGVIKDIAGEFDNPLEGSLTRQISLNLKYSPIEEIYLQLLKEGSISDFNKAISRVFKKYLPEVIDLKDACPKCGGKLQMKEGCQTCTQCGESKCG